MLRDGKTSINARRNKYDFIYVLMMKEINKNRLILIRFEKAYVMNRTLYVVLYHPEGRINIH